MYRNETTGDRWKCLNKQRDSGDRKRSWGFVSPPSSGEARDSAHLDTLLFGLKGYVPQKSGFRISYPKRDNELNQGSVAWHQFKLPLSISSGVLSETKNIETEFPSSLFFNCFHFLRPFCSFCYLCFLLYTDEWFFSPRTHYLFHPFLLFILINVISH